MITDMSLEILALEAITGNTQSEAKFFRILENNFNIHINFHISPNADLNKRIAMAYELLDVVAEVAA